MNHIQNADNARTFVIRFDDVKFEKVSNDSPTSRGASAVAQLLLYSGGRRQGRFIGT